MQGVRRLSAFGFVGAGLMAGCGTTPDGTAATASSVTATTQATTAAAQSGGPGGAFKLAQSKVCETERLTIVTAYGSFRALSATGSYPTSFADLVGVFLTDDPTSRWTFQADPESYASGKAGIGKCAGF